MKQYTKTRTKLLRLKKSLKKQGKFSQRAKVYVRWRTNEREREKLGLGEKHHQLRGREFRLGSKLGGSYVGCKQGEEEGAKEEH